MKKANPGGELQFALSVFREGLERGGCLVCRALADAEARSLHSFLYEGMTTAHVLVNFLAGGGFCPRHFRRATRLGVNRWSVGCVELAILCGQVLPRAAAEAVEIGARRKKRGLFAAAPGIRKQTLQFPGRNCVFCQEWNEREEGFVKLLELVAEREDFSAALAAGGLCLPHGALALASWISNTRAERLRQTVRARADRMAAAIKLFLQKYEERHRKEPFGAEIDAVDQAVDFLAGLEAEGEDGRGARPAAGTAGGSAARKP